MRKWANDKTSRIQTGIAMAFAEHLEFETIARKRDLFYVNTSHNDIGTDAFWGVVWHKYQHTAHKHTNIQCKHLTFSSIVYLNYN